MSEPERVLDMPAIAYEEVQRQQRERAEAVKAQPKTRASKRPKRVANFKPRSAPAQAPRVMRGEVGPAVVAAVDARIAEGLNASQAFEVVAKQRGMKAGAVSANYYRVKRNTSKAIDTSSAPKRPASRKARGKWSPRALGSRGVRSRPVEAGSPPDIEAVLADLSRGVRALSDVVQQQGTEVAELRSRLGRLGSALGE